MQEEEFRRKLLETFRAEGAELVQQLGSGLIALQRTPDREAHRVALESVFRAAHSLKGAARAVGERRIEALCQEVEDLFAAMEGQATHPSPQALDRLHEAVNAIAVLVSAPSGEPSKAQPADPGGQGRPAIGTVRIATERLDALLMRAEELLSAKLQAQHHALGLLDAASVVLPARQQDKRLASLAAAAEQHRRALASMVDALLADAKKALMLPAAPMLEMFPKLAHDLARDQGKEVETLVDAADIEIDRRILEEIRDPLTHLVRNCIDHGIETPDARRRKGKRRAGTLRLGLDRRGEGGIDITVADDGAGIDTVLLAEAAVAAGVTNAEDVAGMAEQDLLALVFRPGFSTRRQVSDLSGRGLGLAIVREKVERLGGTVDVESQPGRGTRFRMRLPVTLATFRGVHVRTCGARFVIPTALVHKALRIPRTQLATVADRPAVRDQAELIALVPLAGVLGLEAEILATDLLQVLVVGDPGNRVGLLVDEILEENEVLVKPLHKPVAGARTVSGATVLPTGEVVPVLEVAHLLATAGEASPHWYSERAAARRRPSALVAEDSITSRALLKNILQAGGFDVATAVDGADALELLKAQAFDVVISDVEMPRVDGFELTARIRADPARASVPVVLVTALDSRGDRERGVEVGASAYVVKSSFDSQTLLDVVRQFI